MANNTPNYNLYKKDPVTDKNDTFNITTMLNENWDKIDTELKNIEENKSNKDLSNVSNADLLNKGTDAGLETAENVKASIIAHNNDLTAHGLSTGVIQTPPIQFGTNTIKNTGKTAMFPDIDFTGHHYVNLLGKDGNCEDTSKWGGSPTTLDTAKKVFGSYAIKCVSDVGASANINRAITLDTSKHYLCSAYVQCTDYAGLCVGTEIFSSVGGGNTNNLTFNVTQRIGFKFQPTQTNMYLSVYVHATASVQKTFYADGIMLNEISADDYNNLTDSQLMTKYPYVDSYGALTNPYFENRKYNLVRNGNCEEGVGYWDIYSKDTGTVICENGKFKFVTTAWNSLRQKFTLKQNTNYYLSGKAENCYIQVTNDAETDSLSTGGTFNTGLNSTVKIRVVNDSAKTSYFSQVMLTEGTTAPTEYKSCEIERFALEGQFTDDDKVTIKDGQVSGLLNWKHKTLYGKDYDWQFVFNHIMAKSIVLRNALQDATPLSEKGIKYDGKVLQQQIVFASDTKEAIVLDAAKNLYIAIPNSDTGWVDSIQPNNDEVKAFMNGWKAVANNGTRYMYWVRIGATDLNTDLTAFPTGTATTLTVATTGTTSITVADAGMFKVGDSINVVGNALTTISAIAGNTLTLEASQNAQAIGRVVARVDNPANDTRILNYCKNNIAPNYEGYQLHYKLANPEPITDINVPVKGSIWSLASGDNYVTVDSGMVLSEVASIKKDSEGSYYLGCRNTSANYDYYAPLKYVNEDYPEVYKNMVYNTYIWHKWENVAGGKYLALAVTLDETKNYDPSATYTVDYQILKTLHAQSFGSLSMTYSQDVFSAINSMANAIEDKQQHNDVLDRLIDLSVYEEISTPDWARYMPYAISSTNILYLNAEFPFKVEKVCIPNIMYKNFTLKYDTTDITNKTQLIGIRTSKQGVALYFSVNDATAISNLKQYGVQLQISIIADCRGRV